MKIEENTIDDLLHKTLRRLLKKSKSSRHLKGTAKEEIGALLILKNPNARLSRSESRAKLFSCLGESLWYIDGSSSIDRISYYIPKYRKMIEVDDSVVHAPGAYGPRIFGSGAGNQFERVAQLLGQAKRRETRKAVIQIYDKSDFLVYLNEQEMGNDVPCTVSLQFFVRYGQLHLMSHMRSNDAYIGLPHDVFAFTFIQELMARRIGLKVGRYIHSVGSLHLYDEDENAARDYLDEGWQDRIPMPTMPDGDPRQSLNWLLKQEHDLRSGSTTLSDEYSVGSYWRDLGRILLLKRLQRDNQAVQFSGVSHQIESEFFRAFVNDQQVKVDSQSDNQLALPIDNS